jgi:hypothetical protein
MPAPDGLNPFLALSFFARRLFALPGIFLLVPKTARPQMQFIFQFNKVLLFG